MRRAEAQIVSARRLVGAALLLAAAACGPARPLATDLAVRVSFEPAPHVGPTDCTVRLTDAAGAPVAGASLELEGNMNHAGMVPVFGDLTETEPGVYATPFEFTMGGDWFLIVRGDLADGRALERVIDLPGVPVDAADGGERHACCSESDAVSAAR